MSKKIVALGIVLAVVVVMLLLKFVAFKPKGLEDFGDAGSFLNSRAKGNPEAPLKITEFIDFQCVKCAEGVQIIDAFYKKYPDKMYVEIKYNPLKDNHKFAIRSATYAECAARQGKFWPFVEILIRTQEKWSERVYVDEAFREIAKQVGMDTELLDGCLADEEVRKLIDREKKQSEAVGVHITPSYVINGEFVAGFREMKKKLEAFFAEKVE